MFCKVVRVAVTECLLSEVLGQISDRSSRVAAQDRADCVSRGEGIWITFHATKRIGRPHMVDFRHGNKGSGSRQTGHPGSRPGVAAEAYAEEILARQVGTELRRTGETRNSRGVALLADALAQFSDKIPPLPDTISREWIYQDRDSDGHRFVCGHTNILLRITRRPNPQHQAIAGPSLDLSTTNILHYTHQNIAELWNVMTRPIVRNGLGLTIDEAEIEVRAIEDAWNFYRKAKYIQEWRRIVWGHRVSGSAGPRCPADRGDVRS